MSFAVAPLGRRPTLTVCRTGYTGEHGYELVVPAGRRRRGVGRADDGRRGVRASAPCGLAARDTLRTEMGYPLHGQDLSPEITPVQARSGWAVGWTKPEFWGRDGAARREGGRARAAAVGPGGARPGHPARRT